MTSRGREEDLPIFAAMSRNLSYMLFSTLRIFCSMQSPISAGIRKRIGRKAPSRLLARICRYTCARSTVTTRYPQQPRASCFESRCFVLPSVSTAMLNPLRSFYQQLVFLSNVVEYFGDLTIEPGSRTEGVSKSHRLTARSACRRSVCSRFSG